eukprot:scaffold269128_cov18-Tisochrysis_lutea.AAC.1
MCVGLGTATSVCGALPKALVLCTAKSMYGAMPKALVLGIASGMCGGEIAKNECAGRCQRYVYVCLCVPPISCPIQKLSKKGSFYAEVSTVGRAIAWAARSRGSGNF